jgi:Cu(I)/Ag(I) efflux system membrane protein CusA/SilA
MLTTGIRTPVGLKIQGGEVNQIEQVGRQVEAALASVPGTRSVFAERTSNGYFLDVSWNRDALARFGLSVEEAQNALSTAVGGDNVSTLIEGRQRYPINVRYQRDFRSDLEALGRVLVQSSSNRQVALSELATIRMVNGPAMLRDEDGLLTGYVFVDVGGRSPGDYVAQARHELHNKLQLPAGYAVLWSGQNESAERVHQRLLLVVPITLLLILCASVLQYTVGREDRDHHFGRSVFRSRCPVDDLPSWVQYEHRGVGGYHRAAWHRRRNRRLHVALSRLGVRAGEPGAGAAYARAPL